MQKFVIERNVAGAGQLSADEVRGIAEKSNEVVASLGGEIAKLHAARRLVQALQAIDPYAKRERVHDLVPEWSAQPVHT